MSDRACPACGCFIFKVDDECLECVSCGSYYPYAEVAELDWVFYKRNRRTGEVYGKAVTKKMFDGLMSEGAIKVYEGPGKKKDG